MTRQGQQGVAISLSKGAGSVGGELGEGTVHVSVALAPRLVPNVS